MTTRRAFTMIELLIIVAIIAVLAAISVPNFLEAQVRSKVSRTHVDMAAVTSALRFYYADHNRYPPNNPELRAFLTAAARVDEVNAATVPTPPDARYSWTADDPSATTRTEALKPAVDYGYYGGGRWAQTYPILASAGPDLQALTTPVAYLSGMLPLDPFGGREREPFVYLNKSDIPTASPAEAGGGEPRRYVLLSYGPDNDFSQPHVANPFSGSFIPYDPTNGTTSAGDIVEYGDGSRRVRPDEKPRPAPPAPGT